MPGAPQARGNANHEGRHENTKARKGNSMLQLNRLCAATTCAVVVASALAFAQAQGFKRTEVQRGDLSIAGREAVQAVAEIQPGASSGKHTHPGEEVGYVLEGTVRIEIEGAPAKMVKAGEGFIVPAGKIHNATNSTSAVAKVLGTYLIEKGKPLATPVP
jgi:quercetin dioxygenase-like cupin family protein